MDREIRGLSSRRLVEYTDIEGIKITSDVYLTAVDSLVVLGKQPPGARL